MLNWTNTFPHPSPPCVVRLERFYQSDYRKMDSDENLRMAFKGIKDKLADLIIPGMRPGMADEGHGISWEFTQTKTPLKGVRITIREEGENA